MDIRQLTYFMVIAEEGQITAAARRLHMAQPPLSQQMKALEEELGVQLLQREPRSVTLTDAGEILYRRARQILTLTDSTRSRWSARHLVHRDRVLVGQRHSPASAPPIPRQSSGHPL